MIKKKVDDMVTCQKSYSSLSLQLLHHIKNTIHLAPPSKTSSLLRWNQFENATITHLSTQPVFSNSRVLKNVFEQPLRFRDGLVWTVGLTVEIKLRFRDGLVWTVGITVEIKLRFRDGLVWTVGLTIEIKLRFRDGLVWTVGLTGEIKLCFSDGLVWTVGLTVEIKLSFQFFWRDADAV